MPEHNSPRTSTTVLRCAEGNSRARARDSRPLLLRHDKAIIAIASEQTGDMEDQQQRHALGGAHAMHRHERAGRYRAANEPVPRNRVNPSAPRGPRPALVAAAPSPLGHSRSDCRSPPRPEADTRGGPTDNQGGPGLLSPKLTLNGVVCICTCGDLAPLARALQPASCVTAAAWGRSGREREVRGRCCPIGEALVARNGADIVTAPHQKHVRACSPGRGCFRGLAGTEASADLERGCLLAVSVRLTRIERASAAPATLLSARKRLTGFERVGEFLA